MKANQGIEKENRTKEHKRKKPRERQSKQNVIWLLEGVLVFFLYSSYFIFLYCPRGPKQKGGKRLQAGNTLRDSEAGLGETAEGRTREWKVSLTKLRSLCRERERERASWNSWCVRRDHQWPVFRPISREAKGLSFGDWNWTKLVFSSITNKKESGRKRDREREKKRLYIRGKK